MQEIAVTDAPQAAADLEVKDATFSPQIKLTAPGPANANERIVRGVKVIGSQLSDEHVHQIIERTKEFQAIGYSSDTIIHADRLRAYRERSQDTRTLKARICISFEFKDHRWERTSFESSHGIRLAPTPNKEHQP